MGEELSTNWFPGIAKETGDRHTWFKSNQITINQGTHFHLCICDINGFSLFPGEKVPWLHINCVNLRYSTFHWLVFQHRTFFLFPSFSPNPSVLSGLLIFFWCIPEPLDVASLRGGAAIEPSARMQHARKTCWKMVFSLQDSQCWEWAVNIGPKLPFTFFKDLATIIKSLTLASAHAGLSFEQKQWWGTSWHSCEEATSFGAYISQFFFNEGPSAKIDKLVLDPQKIWTPTHENTNHGCGTKLGCLHSLVWVPHWLKSAHK